MVAVPSGFPVVVVGAGQAGLAVSYELTARGIEHVVLERARVGQTWRGLWDSFCLVTPNWTMSLPGAAYSATTRWGPPTTTAPHCQAPEHGRAVTKTAAERRGCRMRRRSRSLAAALNPEALAGVLGDARSERAAFNLELEARPKDKEC